MPERRRLFLLLGFLLGTALLALGIAYAVTGKLNAALLPGAKAWGIGAAAAVVCHLTRANLTFALALFAIAELFFLAPYLVRTY